MSMSATSVSAVTNALALYRMGNGEYSAGSVATDPADASKLQLTKLQDGNYGSLLFFAASSFASSPTARSTARVQTALGGLTLGG